MKKLLRLFVVAALAVSMTLCCVACGAKYSEVTEENQAEIMGAFADKISDEAIVGTKTVNERGDVVKRGVDFGVFADFSADIKLDDVGFKGNTKDEFVVVSSIDRTQPNDPVASLSARAKAEGSFGVSGSAEQLAALMDKLGIQSENASPRAMLRSIVLQTKEPAAAQREPSEAEKLIKSLLGKTISGNGEMIFANGIVYVNGKAETTGLKSEAKVLFDIKTLMGGEEEYKWNIIESVEDLQEEIDEKTGMISKDTLSFGVSMLTAYGFKVSADIGNSSIKIEATQEITNRVKQALKLGENDKLDIKTLALTLSLNKAGKISSIKLEVNVDAQMTVAGVAISGNVRGNVEIKTEGLSVSAPNARDYFDMTDVLSALRGNDIEYDSEYDPEYDPAFDYE